MITTRSFLKSLLVAAVAPQILIPKAGDHARWKRTAKMWVVNPEWREAPYEIKELYGSWAFQEEIEVPGHGKFFVRPEGVRFRKNPSGMWVAVYHHIQA